MDLNTVHPSWHKVFQPEIEKEYFAKINSQISIDQQEGNPVFPPKEQTYEAFNRTPLNKVKVVILGQDPYHDDGQAHGLSFSVLKGIKTPPSLVNIYKELSTDILNFQTPNHGELSQWADQGVLLLNTSLSVIAHKANSHSKIGWQKFTDAIIQNLGQQEQPIAFILWGANARSKSKWIAKHHLILESAHPSPLSAYRGFWGSKPFSKVNDWLSKKNQDPIDWQIT